MDSRVDSRFADLSESERDVLGYIAQGMTDEEIADARYVTINTIKTQKKNIRNILRIKGEKPHVLNQYATRFAHENGLVNDSELYSRIDSRFADLSEVHREVLGYIAQGMTDQEIADKRVVTINTIKTNKSDIRIKFGILGKSPHVINQYALLFAQETGTDLDIPEGVDTLFAGLSKAKREVLVYFAQGMTCEEIANRRKVTINTIKTRLNQIRDAVETLGESRHALIGYALLFAHKNGFGLGVPGESIDITLHQIQISQLPGEVYAQKEALEERLARSRKEYRVEAVAA